MRACRGNLQCPFHVFLSLYIAEVRQFCRILLRLPRRFRCDGDGAVQMRRKLAHIRHGDHRQIPCQRRLSGILGGNVQRPEAGLPCGNGHGQHAVDRTELPLQTQLSEEGARLLRQPAQLRGGENAEKNGKIVERAALAGVGRGEIQRDPADRELEAAVLDGGPDPLTRFLDRRIRQSDNLKSWQAVGDKALHGNRIPLYPAQSQRVHATDHRTSLISLFDAAGRFLFSSYRKRCKITNLFLIYPKKGRAFALQTRRPFFLFFHKMCRTACFSDLQNGKKVLE